MMFEIDTESFIEFLQKKLEQLWELIPNMKLWDKQSQFSTKDRLYIDLKTSMDCAVYNYYMCLILHKKFEEIYEKQGEDEAFKTNVDMFFEYEFYSFILNIRGSLDCIAKIISIEYTGKFRKDYGFGNLVTDLKTIDAYGKLNEFQQYILQESKMWVFHLTDEELNEYKEWIGYPPDNEKKRIDFKKIRYNRCDDEYKIFMDMIDYPKLNDFRRNLAHGKKINTFQIITTYIDDKTKPKKWYHTISNKPILTKGQIYSEKRTLEYIEEVFKKTKELQIETLNQINSLKKT